jgi:hypothetical protein
MVAKMLVQRRAHSAKGNCGTTNGAFWSVDDHFLLAIRLAYMFVSVIEECDVGAMQFQPISSARTSSTVPSLDFLSGLMVHRATAILMRPALITRDVRCGFGISSSTA